MYLKSIEVQGFKSFANKIVFQFHNGITGIVGPNGSGKSNVADAVRWVLGEQRVKQLRGGSMQDVIFAGTQTRKPLGYAYVAITLDNSDHVLSVPYTEVTVARRLYRSGESEYLINGTAVRLKDVNELFYDTGIGKEGYSIIGQGQIERILSGKPEERRELFDEAAGIVKFKRRKQEAQKKLENEQQNLIRVNDILSELSRQVEPLGRQAEKAKIYLKKRDELKAYDVNLFLVQFHEMKQAIDDASQKFETASEQLSQVKQESEEVARTYEQLSAQLGELEKEVADLQEQLTSLRLGKQEKENRIVLLQEQIRAAMLDRERAQDRLKAIAEEIEKKQADCQSLSEKISSIEENIRIVRQRAASRGKALDECRAKGSALQEQLEAIRQKRMELLGEKSKIEADLQRCDALLDQYKQRKAALDSDTLRLYSQKTDQSSELADIDKDQKALDEQIDGLNAQSAELDGQLQTLQEQLTDHNSKLEVLQTAWHRSSSRLETLKGIAERYDGYGSSIRRVMEKRSTHAGILGVVADLIRTKAEYETAIETALGGSIQNVVTEDEDTAKAMIEYLKRERLGRATFLPLTAISSAPPLKKREALEEKGVVGLASSLVTCEKKYQALANHLLGKTIVADTVDSAIALAKKYHYSLRIVTLEGELLTPGGAMTGGAFKNTSNLLSRRREIDQLQKETEAHKKSLDDLRRNIEQARAERARMRSQMVEISSALQELYLKQNTLRTRKAEIEGQKDRTLEDYERIIREKDDIAQKSEQLMAQKAQAGLDLEELDRQEKVQEEQHTQLTAQLDEVLAREKELTPLLEQDRLEEATQSQEEAYQRAEMNRVSSEHQTLLAEQKNLEDALGFGESELASRKADIQFLEQEIQTQTGALDEAAKTMEEKGRRREEIHDRQQKLFHHREELAEQNALLEKECLRLHSQVEKLEERREERIAYMWDEYELTYSTAAALRRDDLGSQSEWKKRMNVLKGEIRELGSVNVGAIEEYKEVSERFAFMTTQHDDLIKAEKTLENIIRDLDDGMRRQFTEQFARIQEEFDKTFRELFGGGKGTLELVEGEDILEAGVNIAAQPPGKKLVHMMQMSGGEKALTAIALLFAIQNLKPSPFCLLDEIEAALDENNVLRYAEYLHKLTKHTQFIIITHRRGTMAAADRLYGITMQEKGVSALVSVNLIEKDLDE